MMSVVLYFYHNKSIKYISFMNSKMKVINIPDGELLMQIDDIFTEEECDRLISSAEASGLQDQDRGNANYGRVTGIMQFNGQPLNEFLWNRLSHIIPTHVYGKPVSGLNDHFRFSKYHEGQFFDIHKDGINQDSEGNRSALTLNIFLNDNFKGGETDFFSSDNRNDLRFSVIPKTGRGGLFFAQQYHSGNEILEGVKYLLRTDVMVKDY
jgi:2OG-Fe(II) oxygenase superfamily